MIVRECDDTFIMIEQDYHGIVSGEIMRNWDDAFFDGAEFRESVYYAIRYHDYGWQLFDRQPFWNDLTHAPFTFSDYPLSPKIAIYTLGIDEVEKSDPYAALLCSMHYSRFLLGNSTEMALEFIEQEQKRQDRIIRNFGDIDKVLFQFHYDLLRLGDDLSLYLCLNKPGVAKEDEHYYYQNGIALPAGMNNDYPSTMNLRWVDKETVAVSPFPFQKRISISLKQKSIKKQSIKENGLIKSYENTPFEVVQIDLVPGR